MIKLYQFPPNLGLPNMSPLCMKVETYLRMAALPYECPRGSMRASLHKGMRYAVCSRKVFTGRSCIRAGSTILVPQWWARACLAA
jgi:hypothetical protein